MTEEKHPREYYTTASGNTACITGELLALRQIVELLVMDLPDDSRIQFVRQLETLVAEDLARPSHELITHSEAVAEFSALALRELLKHLLALRADHGA